MAIARSAIVIAMLALPIFPSSSRAQVTDVRTLIPEPPRSASSLHEMWDASTVVIVGHVQEVDAPTLQGGAVRRLEVIAVDEVIKDPQALVSGATIAILEPGGTVQRGTVEYRTAYLRQPLRVGEKAILFLEPAGHGDKSMPVFEVKMTAGASIKYSSVGQSSISVRDDTAAFPEFRGHKSVTLPEVVELLRSYR